MKDIYPQSNYPIRGFLFACLNKGGNFKVVLSSKDHRWSKNMQKWQNIPSTFIYRTFWQILDSGTCVSTEGTDFGI